MTHISAEDLRKPIEGSGGILENNIPGIKGGQKTIFDPAQAKKAGEESDEPEENEV